MAGLPLDGWVVDVYFASPDLILAVLESHRVGEKKKKEPGQGRMKEGCVWGSVHLAFCLLCISCVEKRGAVSARW